MKLKNIENETEASTSERRPSSDSKTKTTVEIIGRHGKKFRFKCEQLIENIMLNPTLPDDFNNRDIQSKDERSMAMWNVVYITTHKDNSPSFIAFWGGNTRYDLRRLDGGAWDRSTCLGQYGSLKLAIETGKEFFGGNKSAI